jgi:hypothetical protein
MSEIEPNKHEEIARRLREDGPVQAPSDLAGEVMKRVRSEPRRSTSAVRRPLVTLLAAALVTVALVAGIAKLGGGSASTAGSVGAGGASEGHAPGKLDSGSAPEVVQSATVSGVPRAVLLDLRDQGVTLSVLSADSPNSRCIVKETRFGAMGGLTLDVPYAAWSSVQTQLRTARKEAVPAAASLVTVQLRRLAPGATTKSAPTCP